MTTGEHSLAIGIYQCPTCHGPSSGPGECRTCLANPHVDYAKYFCRSCGFGDCPNAGNALDYCPRWDGTDQP